MTAFSYENYTLFILQSPTTGSDEVRVNTAPFQNFKKGDKLPERVAEHWKGFLANQK